jgi:hypothetical protein
MDDESSKEAVDTGLSDATDTSNNEEFDAEAALLDIEVTDEEMDGPEEKDSDTESTDEAATETEEEVEDESEADVQEEKPKEEDTTSEEETRRRNDEFAKQRIAEREARAKQQAEFAELKRQQQEDYLREAEDERDMALRQLQIDAYNNKIETNSSKLETAMDRAVADIDLFRTGTQVQKDALIASLDDFEARFVRRDNNGDPVEITGDVYQHLQAKADEIRRLAGEGARIESKAKEQTKARTDIVPTRTPKEPRKDPYLSAFEEEAKRP